MTANLPEMAGIRFGREMIPCILDRDVMPV